MKKFYDIIQEDKNNYLVDLLRQWKILCRKDLDEDKEILSLSHSSLLLQEPPLLPYRGRPSLH